MNQWCVKKDKNAFKLAFRFHAFPENPEMLETLAHKKFNFQHFKTLLVCSYHVTYAFQSESTLYSCLNVKELLARNRREI